jgi:site-specific recombinase XerD
MHVQQIQPGLSNEISFELLDDDGSPIEIVASFMRHLRARGYSPHTFSAYCYDLLHFMTFLKERQLTYLEFSPPHAVAFLEYLRRSLAGTRHAVLASRS